MSKGKKAAIALLAIMALLMAASCNNGGGFSLPGDMIGTYEGEAGTITISADNIIYEPTGSQTEINFRNLFDIGQGQYEITKTDTSFAFYLREMPGVGYWFTLSGDTLTMRIASTTTSTTTYTRVSI